MKIIIQGGAYSYHDQVRKILYPNSTPIYIDNFDEVFSTLQNTPDSLALIACENSTVGQINQVYDLLQKHEFNIIKEYYLQIAHSLAGALDIPLENIKNVYSHPMALLQASPWIEKHLIREVNLIEHHDTALAAKDLAENKFPSFSSVVCSDLAAQQYGLKILAKSINPNNNFTRFIILDKPNLSQLRSKQNHKTSLVFRTSHHPGSLAKILNIFAEYEINLSKLNSRPVIENAWHYYFYADLECSYQRLIDESILKKIKPHLMKLKILGSYPIHHF